MAKLSKQRGLSLIELMVTLFIVSILLGIGGPQFAQFMANNRMAAAVNDLNVSLHMARTEAIKRNAFVTVCPSTTFDAAAPVCEPTASFTDGWIVFVDADNNGAPDLTLGNDNVLLQSHHAMNTDIDLLAGNAGGLIPGDQFMVFGPNGYPLTQVNGNNAIFSIQLCDKRGAKDTGADIGAGRWITISPTGRPQMHRSLSVIESANNPLGGCAYNG